LTGPFVAAGDLAAALPGPAVLDVRWALSGALPEEYAAGHVPGAHFVDLDRDLAGPPGDGGRHPLPEVAVFEAAMRRCGVAEGRDVVLYDGGSGAAAARGWWLLRWAGHDPVRVLAGGWAAWTAAGLPVSTDPPTPEDGDFIARPGAMPVLDAAGAARLARAGTLLDSRAPERFRGEREPIDPVAGHIPGAVNLPAGDLGGDVADRVKELGGAPYGAYCGSGVAAAQVVLELAAAGVPASLYVGSWSEWIRDPTRPIG